MAILSLSQSQVRKTKLIYHTCTDSFCMYTELSKPNAAHMLLAILFMPKYLKILAPAAKSFHWHLITQNVDCLFVAALKSLAEQVSNNSTRLNRVPVDPIIQMHGSLFDIVCTKCGHAQDFSSLLRWVLRTYNAPTM